MKKKTFELLIEFRDIVLIVISIAIVVLILNTIMDYKANKPQKEVIEQEDIEQLDNLRAYHHSINTNRLIFE